MTKLGQHHYSRSRDDVLTKSMRLIDKSLNRGVMTPDFNKTSFRSASEMATLDQRYRKPRVPQVHSSEVQGLIRKYTMSRVTEGENGVRKQQKNIQKDKEKFMNLSKQATKSLQDSKDFSKRLGQQEILEQVI